MADDFSNAAAGLDSPGNFVKAITGDDSNDLAKVARGLYVGTTGDVKITSAGGTTEIIPSVPAGAILPIRVKRLFSTGTTAGGIIAIW